MSYQDLRNPIAPLIDFPVPPARTCPVCLRTYVIQCECLTDRVRAISDHWKRIVVNGEHLQMPLELCNAYGTVENADCWRVWEMAIPQDEIDGVYRALEMICAETRMQ